MKLLHYGIEHQKFYLDHYHMEHLVSLKWNIKIFDFIIIYS
jgi:hypothetical protein